ncbi:MAG: bifunctional N-acetylglucosamine-1-phosphate uridyltransferase/glucosamine-1-phosphate acetyltransferase [Candidatus Omnitrophota bacterium]|nr:MAG: bifunctional N-acetylglucosamine-1-phosphate uridyltransferase/glucosamine-1-phosphate acetyltransferase [Candidatus Omnitrophota bacterium]
MKNVACIILAAGRGTRMKSEVPKVLQQVHSRPLLSFILEALEGAIADSLSKKILIVGYKDKTVKNAFRNLDSVTQTELLGSGDAVKRAKGVLSKFKGDVLVLYGDTPFIRKETIRELIRKHAKEKASCTLLAANLKDPSGYGRILRDDNDNIVKIIEERDTSIYEKIIEEINVGLYCFNKEDLFSGLAELKINAKKQEYYLTDIVEVLRKANKKITSVSCKNPIEALGINSKLDLARANNIIRKNVLELLMLKGVTIVDPDSTFVNMKAKIGKDTIIHPHTIIEGDVTIGKGCEIGPFARIRKQTTIDDGVEIGNFTELVRTSVSSGTKIKHMTYLGDAEIGRNVNIGAGTITANFDGKSKNKTIIEDGSFIGVGSIFIAPVRVGSGAVVGAGSVVTKGKNVPPHKTVIGIPARVLKGGRKR